MRAARIAPRSPGPSMGRYAKAFFDLQLEFAEKVTALSGLPLARAVFEYTNFYIRFALEAYRRLFPPAYLATARVMPGRFRHMPLWGQFLDRHGEIRETMTRPFYRI